MVGRVDNNQPIAQIVNVTASESNTITESFNVSDIDSADKHTFTIVSEPLHGQVEVNEDGTFTYDPGDAFGYLTQGESEQVTFTYQATDNSGQNNALSDTQTVTITITGTNSKPVANVVSIEATRIGTANGTFSATDTDSDIFTYEITNQPQRGSVLNNNNGTFTFLANEQFNDLAMGDSTEVTFEYVAIDDLGARSEPQIVTINVTRDDNNQPVVEVQNEEVNENSTVIGTFNVTDDDSSDTHTFNIVTQPSSGRVTNNNDGTFVFDTDDAFSDLGIGETRTVTFTYQAIDNTGSDNAASDIQTVTITITGTNSQPVAQVISASTNRSSTVTENFLVTDSDSDTHTFEIITQPEKGTVINNNDGSFTFLPGSDFNDLAINETVDITFTYTAIDDSNTDTARSEPQTITVSVTRDNNNQPIAEVVNISANDNLTTTGTFIVSDTDTSDTHTFNIETQPSKGIIVNNNDGTFTFDPNEEFNDLSYGDTETLTFSYTVTDNSGLGNATSESRTVTITVTGQNDQPIATQISDEVRRDSTVTGGFDVTDVDSNNHTYNIVTQPNKGSVTNNNDGTFTYDPGDDFMDLEMGGSESITFTYTATDDSGESNATSEPQTITIVVTREDNYQPVVSSIPDLTTDDNQIITHSFNVTDEDLADTHTFNILTQPGNGTVVDNNDGTFSFDPGEDFKYLEEGQSETITFTYQAIDNSESGNSTSTTATVTISITGINEQPVAEVVAVATNRQTTVTGNFAVTDPDNSNHTYTITTQPSKGSVINNDDGTFTYDPGDDFNDLLMGESVNISFSYTADDNSGLVNAVSEPQNITITITRNDNYQPTASAVSYQISEDETINGDFIYEDPDIADTHNITVVSQPNSGVLVNNNDGTFSFSPGDDFQDLAEGETGRVTFTYQVTDNTNSDNASSDVKRVTITITGINDRPIAEVVSVQTVSDNSITENFLVTDPDNQQHTFTITSQPEKGTVVNNSDGSFTFSPNNQFDDLSEGETANVTFTYIVIDNSNESNAESEAATVTITITGTNAQPSAEVVTVTTEEGENCTRKLYL